MASNLKDVIEGVFIFFFSILGTIVGYYVVDIVLEIMTDLDVSSLIIGLFWVGLMIVWTMGVIVVPGYKIMRGLGKIQ